MSVDERIPDLREERREGPFIAIFGLSGCVQEGEIVGVRGRQKSDHAPSSNP